MNTEISRKAEALLQEKYSIEELLADEDLPAVIQELRARQLELKLQNEAMGQAQQELALRHDKYVNLYELAPIGYFTLREDGVILASNLTGATLLGTEREQLIEQPLSNFVMDEDQDIYYWYRRQLFGTQTVQDCEIRLIKGDGSQFYARFEGVTVVSHDENRPGQAYVAVSDITVHKEDEAELRNYRDRLKDLVKNRTTELQKEIAERKQIETALAEERNLLRSLVDNLPDYIYVKDTRSRFLLANEAVRRHLGAATIDEIIGRTDFDFSPPELATQYYADEQEIFRTGRPLILHKEPVFDHETESRKWVSTIKVPLYDSEGKIIGLVGMNRDITKLKQTEAALRDAHDDLEMKVLQRTADLVKANQELQAEINERKQAEQALRESEEGLRLVIQNMPVMMNALDAKGNIIVWNRECEQVTGYGTDEMVNNAQAMEMLYPDEAERRHIMTKWIESAEDYRNLEWELTAKDGRTKKVAWSNISHQFPISGWTAWGIGVDVTEWRQAEESLRESEQRYKQLLGSVTDYIYTVTIEQNRIVRTSHSPNCVAVTGYTSQEYEADPNLWYRMIYEPDRQLVIEQTNRLLTGNSVEPLEHRIIHKDGSIRWVRNTSVLHKDEQKQVVAYDGLISDITARKKAEEALRHSEHRYRLLMEHASDGILIQNPEGDLLKVNSKVCEMLGFGRAELLQKNVKDLISAADLAATPLDLDELRGGQALLRERNLVRQDGAILPVEISAKMIEPDRVLAILRDITERKNVERREKLAHQLGRQLTTLLNPDALLNATVNRLKEILGYYHAHVFLVEEPRSRPEKQEPILVVREGTGEAGAVLKQQRHTIPLHTEHSLVAQAARSFEPVVVNDVSQHPDHLPNPLLSKTRSEVAIPLFRGLQPIGVLDVQHTKVNHFDVNEIRTLQIVASQLSVALTNAQLFAENARRLAIIEHSSDLIALIDLNNGLIIDINPAGVQMAGYTQAEELLYKPLPEIFPPHNLKQIEQEGIPTALEQGVWRGEGLMRAGGSKTLPVAQTIFVIHNEEDRPHMLAVIMTDIAKRKQAEEERERLFEEVKAGQKRLQILSHRLVEVQEAERRHIARELHDEVGQLLTGLKLTLEMSASLPAEAIKTNLKEAQSLVNELIAQVRELSLELRPAMLDDLGLLPTLQWHFERYTAQTQIEVKFKHAGLNQRFAPAVETAAYRIMQEALTNVARYAEVEEVSVEMRIAEAGLNVWIEDQGTGFDLEVIQTAAKSSGLSGMYERAALLGGQVAVESAPGVGTRLVAQLPLKAPVEEATQEGG